MEKVSVFILIPTNKTLELPQTIIEEIKHMIGTLNCKQPSDNCVLHINYQISEEQMEEISKFCDNAGFTSFFIIAPKECNNFHELYVEL